MIRWMLLLVIGCANVEKTNQQLAPGHDYSIRLIAEQSLDESRKFITNKRNYLQALFEPRYDPYYNTPRWTDECLAENIIEEIRENDRGVFFVSKLNLNFNFESGFCSTPATSSYFVVYYHCSGTRALRELRVAAKSFNPSFDWTSLCK